jgi:hypothetical protein
MNATHGEVSIPRGELVLPRFLATILFSLAAFMWLVTVIAAVMVLTGDRYAIRVLAGAGPVAWMLSWL